MDIVLTEDVNDKLWEYTHSVNTEIAAWGYVEPNDEDFIVSEVFLVPQTVSATEVDFVSDGLPYAVDKAMNEGKIDQLRFCWHSHVNMGTGYSGTDEDMIRKVRDAGPIPWLVNVIFNKQGDTNGRLDIFRNGFDSSIAPLHHVKGIELDVCRSTQRNIRSSVVAEISEHVNKRTYPVNKNKAGTQTRRQSDSDWQKAWGAEETITPANRQLESGAYDWGDSPVADNTPLDPEEMTKGQLEYEVAAAQQMHELGIGWDSVPDSEGWIHWFDQMGKYQGMCMSDELVERAKEVYAKIA
jgi:hypothetical protein